MIEDDFTDEIPQTMKKIKKKRWDFEVKIYV